LPDDFFLLFGTVLDEVEFEEGMGTFKVGIVEMIASVAIVSLGVRGKVSQSSAEACRSSFMVPVVGSGTIGEQKSAKRLSL